MTGTGPSVFLLLFCGGALLTSDDYCECAEHADKENTDNNPYEYHIGGVLSSNDSEGYFKQTIEVQSS